MPFLKQLDADVDGKIDMHDMKEIMEEINAAIAKSERRILGVV